MRTFILGAITAAMLIFLAAPVSAATSFDSGAIQPDAEFRYTFTEELESGFYYTCKFHTSVESMVHVIADSDGEVATHMIHITGGPNDPTIFTPQHAVIEVGDTVRWINDDEIAHTVTYDDAATQAAMGDDAPGHGDDHDHGEHGSPSIGILGLFGTIGAVLLLRRR